MITICSKQRYDTRGAAETAARKTTRGTLDIGYARAYRCTKCRKPNGRRGGAWHWGHARPDRRRRQW